LVGQVVALQTRNNHLHQVKSLLFANRVAQVEGAETKDKNYFGLVNVKSDSKVSR
jgi:hypothetical protein